MEGNAIHNRAKLICMRFGNTYKIRIQESKGLCLVTGIAWPLSDGANIAPMRRHVTRRHLNRV